MTVERNIISNLYRRLLNFYPRTFREQLGEAMEQTFNDLYNERKQYAKREPFGFVLWAFMETAEAIVQEHILLLIQGNPMKNTLTSLRSPAIISFLIVIPFMILELVNRRNFNEGFPIPLFVIMWLLPMIFIIILTPIVQNVRAGNSLIANPINLLLRVALLVLIAWMWTGILIDQLPCFLGVPNCD